MMTQQDLKQLAQKGISEQQIETQLGRSWYRSSQRC